MPDLTPPQIRQQTVWAATVDGITYRAVATSGGDSPPQLALQEQSKLDGTWSDVRLCMPDELAAALAGVYQAGLVHGRQVGIAEATTPSVN